MTRPSRDEVFLSMAREFSALATCSRRSVACILVNERGHIIGSGYNGPASGEPHCISTACAGAGMASGTGLSVCEAIHAEANALIRCSNIHEIHTAYVTTPPCRDCVKLLRNTACRRIVFTGDYPHAPEARELWTRANKDYANYHKQRLWIHNG